MLRVILRKKKGSVNLYKVQKKQKTLCRYLPSAGILLNFPGRKNVLLMVW